MAMGLTTSVHWESSLGLAEMPIYARLLFSSLPIFSQSSGYIPPSHNQQLVQYDIRKVVPPALAFSLHLGSCQDSNLRLVCWICFREP